MKKTEPLIGTIKIELNEEIFNEFPECKKEAFRILIHGEMEEIAATLSRKTNVWMYNLRDKQYEKD
jgi:hypothetical protein